MRGAKEIDRLKEFCLYKLSLERNAKKGWPGLKDIRSLIILLKKEVEELDSAVFKHVISKNDYLEQVKYPEDHEAREIELECADVANFCAMIADVVRVSKNEGHG